MTPSSSGQHLKRNGINTHPIKNSPDKIKNYKPPTRIKSKERQTAIQVDNGNLSRERHLGEKRRPKIIRIEKPRQEICAPLKWLCFFINFCIFLVSVACLALGLYLFVNAPRLITEPADVLLNPAVLLASIGLISGFVSLFGMFGSLRDNVFLLKLFALCVFFGYLFLVVCTCLLFLLFYSDVTGETSTFISIQSVLLHSIARYHSNKNYADFIDYLQEQLECCGSTTFHDWQFSEQFKCNATNPYPERCGVPYSCCRKSVVSRAGAGEVQNPLTPAIRSIQCWQNAQKKREQELDSDIYVLGCLQPLRTLFDSHALHIGMIVLSIIFPVCVTVCLSQCLARQIDYQHFLLRREQRRIARNERRERRYLEQKGENKIGEHKKQTTGNVQKQTEKVEVVVPLNKLSPPRSPPKVKPPPTPKNDEEAAQLGTAIRAGKLEWKIGKSGRNAKGGSRASSFSPLRNLGIKNEKDKKDEVKRKSNNKIKDS